MKTGTLINNVLPRTKGTIWTQRYDQLKDWQTVTKHPDYLCEVITEDTLPRISELFMMLHQARQVTPWDAKVHDYLLYEETLKLFEFFMEHLPATHPRLDKTVMAIVYGELKVRALAESNLPAKWQEMGTLIVDMMCNLSQSNTISACLVQDFFLKWDLKNEPIGSGTIKSNGARALIFDEYIKQRWNGDMEIKSASPIAPKKRSSKFPFAIHLRGKELNELRLLAQMIEQKHGPQVTVSRH